MVHMSWGNHISRDIALLCMSHLYCTCGQLIHWSNCSSRCSCRSLGKWYTRSTQGLQLFAMLHRDIIHRQALCGILSSCGYTWSPSCVCRVLSTDGCAWRSLEAYFTQCFAHIDHWWYPLHLISSTPNTFQVSERLDSSTYMTSCNMDDVWGLVAYVEAFTWQCGTLDTYVEAWYHLFINTLMV